MRIFGPAVVLGSFLLCVSSGVGLAREAQAKGLQIRDLPVAVQKTVQANLKGARIKNIGKETEDGVEQFEIETILAGRARDFNVDAKGTLLVVEEATTLDAVPAAAKASILKAVAGAKLTSVETVQKPGQPATYEVGYRDKSGRRHEAAFRADGSEIKN